MKTVQKIALTTLAALTTAGGLCAVEYATAAPRGKNPGRVARIDTPLALFGARGAGTSIQLSLVTERGARNKVKTEIEMGFDRNGDGVIADDEYEAAIKDRRDVRGTGINRRGKVFRADSAPGRRNVFVWDTLANIPEMRLVSPALQYTPEGRPIVDPNDQQNFLVDPSQQGVRLRARAIRGKGRRLRASDWVYTNNFSVDNSIDSPTTVTVDAAFATQAPLLDLGPVGVVAIEYTVRDADSEDANGNGVLDSIEGEDKNLNGELDTALVGMTYDYYRLQPGEDPSLLGQLELEGLPWSACTVFESDSDPTVDLPAEAAGSSYRFSWYVSLDEREPEGAYILRGRAFDGVRSHGPYTYVLDPIDVVEVVTIEEE